MSDFQIEEPGGVESPRRVPPNPVVPNYGIPQVRRRAGLAGFVADHSFGLIKTPEKAAVFLAFIAIVILTISGYYSWRGISSKSRYESEAKEKYATYIKDCMKSGYTKYQCEQE